MLKTIVTINSNWYKSIKKRLKLNYNWWKGINNEKNCIIIDTNSY